MDLFLRANALPATQLIAIVGEATFHQFYSESASTAPDVATTRLEEFSGEYHQIRK